MHLSNIRLLKTPYVLKLPEGFGKTSGHFKEVINEIMLRGMKALNWEVQQFTYFACRKREQAEQKAKEFREQCEWESLVLKPFRYHYEMACKIVGEAPMGEFEFSDSSLRGMLEEIRHSQSDVFDRLVEDRKKMWEDTTSNSATVLFGTHDLAQTWHYSQTSRLWNHPEIRPVRRIPGRR
jgi:hypothetical protein